MMTELNSQRVSYYTGVKLIRHHQSASTANNATGFFHPHHNSNQQHTHHHPHFQPQQQQHPPLHHPGHYLPCPTGPPHLQHPGPLNSPGGVIVANGPPQQQQHHHQNHHHPQGGNGFLGGSSTTTRLYTGSPLIRSGAYHSVPGANSKRSYKQGKGHPHGNGLQKNGGSHHHNHHHHLPNSGGSCSSGTSSSSSSNEHLNNIHQTTSPGSPTQTSGKSLDIVPLKLSPSPGESSGFGLGSSSSANSSPGPDSPGLKSSPSPSSTLSSNSSDGNKDLDHFYFLDEHWKPSNDGGAVTSSMSGSGDMMMDLSSGSPTSSGGGGSGSSACAQWSSSSPSAVHNSASALTMMVDQFFCHDNLSPFPEGEVGSGGNEMRDLNNNLVGQGGDILEMTNQNILPPHHHNHLHRHHSFSGFHSTAVGSHREGGAAAGLLNFGPTTTKFGNSTVVNVETQIGTFNGQRDLEIRLCFIKGDRGPAFSSQQQDPQDRGIEQQAQLPGPGPILSSSAPAASNGGGTTSGEGFGVQSNNNKGVAVIGDPFSTGSKSFTDQQRECESRTSSVDSGAHNELPQHG